MSILYVYSLDMQDSPTCPPTEYLIYFREDRRHLYTMSKYSILHADDVVSPTTPMHGTQLVLEICGLQAVQTAGTWPAGWRYFMFLYLVSVTVNTGHISWD